MANLNVNSISHPGVAMPDIHFNCTSCGNCCRELRLPLSVEEAIRWLKDGNSVQVLCEAIPWPEEPSSSDQHAAYKRERSFFATSGGLPIRVLVTLAAPLGNDCPNLLANKLCGIYERRPQVCRIYPAEVNPFRQFVTTGRRCPPEAWQVGGKPLIKNAVYADSELRLLIQTRLNQTIADVPFQETLCATLGIYIAAMANEGYVAHSPDNVKLLEALQETRAQSSSLAQDWEFISDRTETVEAIRSCGAKCSLWSERQSSAFEYLSLFSK